MSDGLDVGAPKWTDANRVGSAGSTQSLAAPRGYVLETKLGDGAEGGAWRGHAVADQRQVVLKPVAAASASVREAFAALRRSPSPHLPAALDIVEGEDRVTWMVTEWMPGSVLSPGPAAVRDVARQGQAVAHALAALHRAGVHHGDVSAGNVIETPRGPVLVDLGQLGRPDTGTPGFIAPEVFAGRGSMASDRFALGSLLVWRLFGEHPWRRPEAVVAVRGQADVVARLDALDPGGTMGTAMRRLLTRLLDPDPRRRDIDTGSIVDALGSIASAGEDAGPAWWIPSRWPYRGPSLAEVTSAVRDGVARLVLVSGPEGSGRARLAEELAGQLQTQGVRARVFDAVRLVAAAEFAAGSSWIEAWLGLGADAGVVVLPDLRGEADADALAQRLVAACRLANAPLVVAVEQDASDVARGRADVRVVEVAPWTAADVEGVLEGVLDGDPAARVACAASVATVTAGWPAQVVRAIEASAARDVLPVRDDEVEAVLRDAKVVPGLPQSVARHLLRVQWGVDELRGAELPSHLHDGAMPLRSAVVRARASLTLPELRAWATRAIESAPSLGIALAVDAEDPRALAQAVEDAQPGDPDELRALDWVERTAATFKPTVLAWAIDRLLALGHASRAASLGREAPTHPGVDVQWARALQRTGDTQAALDVLDRAALDEDDAWHRRGLRWRVLVDRGQADDALQEAERAEVGSLVRTARLGFGARVALLWSAYAAMVGGKLETATSRLSAAQGTSESGGSASAAIEARCAQLLGNIAHAQGRLADAAQAFSDATTAFERAAEPVGALMLRGSLCALAIPTLSIRAGLEHGRAAVRGMIARGQWNALVEAALNLVQLLGRVGAVQEAHRLGLSLQDLSEAVATEPASKARLRRIDAELATLGPVEPSGEVPPTEDIEARFSAAAQGLQSAELPAEAAEAWGRAATYARLGRRFANARAHLERARLQLAEVDDEAALAEFQAATLELAVDEGVPGEVERVLAAMQASTVASTERWLRRSRLETAWLLDRALLRAATHCFEPDHPLRAALASRILSSLEAVMMKTKDIDRSAVRASLTRETPQASALRELLGELEPSSADAPRSAPAVQPSPASASAERFDRLLRMYRRFAREDRLEPLLEQVVDAVMDYTGAERGAVVVVRPDGTQLEVTRALSDGSEGGRFSRSVIARVLESGEAVLSVDAAEDERFDGSSSISHLNLRSVLAAPLRFREKVVGAIYVDHRLRRGNFDESDLASIEAFADLAALAVAHAAVLQEVRSQAARLAEQQTELTSLLERRETEVTQLREDVRSSTPRGHAYRGIIGSSAAMERVFRLIDRLGDSDVPVVIHGESGTGKELVARAIHESGGRGEGPFVAENCGAIPETLLESVLFGHAKGAFTGAHKAKPGLLEAANGGTIFLDEVGEMSPAMQTKLLRVLQESEVRRVGETTSRAVDVRVVAASNRDLDAMVAAGDFRQDLYYRINVVRLDLPPLRERVEDIPALIEHFAGRHGGGRALEVSPAALRELCNHQWPGNVRELENEVQRWLALCEGAVEPGDLRGRGSGSGVDRAPVIDPDDLQIRPRVDRLERQLIAAALERTSNNQTKAAMLLGLSRYGLQKKLKRMAEDDRGE